MVRLVAERPRVSILSFAEKPCGRATADAEFPASLPERQRILSRGLQSDSMAPSCL